MGSRISICTHVRPSIGEKSEGGEHSNGFHPHRLGKFSYKVLKEASEKFSSKNLAGQGGCGDVYKGWLNYQIKDSAKPGCGFPVAIKRIKKHGLDEWKNELRILSSFHHPNVVKLLGYCSEGEHKMLVFEFMPMGNLEENLSRDCCREVNWMKRMEIAKGLAKGLEYLHTIDRPIIHRDIKSANILLDHDLTPKIADFGLSRFGPQGEKTHISTRVLGSRGYFAPEYIGTGHLTLKTDIYSLGVVLLEILSGLKAVKMYPDGRRMELAHWAAPYLADKTRLHRVIDNRIVNYVDIEQAYEFATVVSKCLSRDPTVRPTITQVLHSLQQLNQHINHHV